LPSSDPAVDLLTKRLGETKSSHETVVAKVESLYKSYRGVLRKESEAADWVAKYHPPYILQMVEAMIAAIIDPNPRVRVRPRPKIGEDPVERNLAAKTLENLINYSLDQDGYAQKQRDWVWQALICGTTIAKVDWKTDYALRKSLEYTSTPIHHPDTGEYLDTIPMLSERTHTGPRYDGPCISVRDIRDFYWPESAVNIQSAPYVIDRVWMTPSDAKDLAKSMGKNVEEMESSVFSPESQEREQAQGRDRVKGLLPVDEMWENNRVVTILNGQVVLRDDDNPFWHGQKPFVITSAMPEPFQFTGVSIVELVAELQEMLWGLQNQRLDSLRLMSNMIMLIRADTDIDQFEWAPGALWPMEDPKNQVTPLEINPAVANMTLDAEALIKGDLQNIPGGALFAGADSQTIDQKTATGVSIVSSIAQKLVQARQQNFRYGQREIVEQTGQNLQQLMRGDRAVRIAGAGAAEYWHPVGPTDIQGEFDYVLDVNDESVIRQERQAEWQAKLQTLAQVAQVAMLGGAQINWSALLTDALEQGFGVQDGSRYVQATPPQGQAPGLQQQAQQSGQGVTSPLAIAPSSPSNDASLNPAVMMSRMGAQNGGPNNAG
jgi:hypothetical protein